MREPRLHAGGVALLLRDGVEAILLPEGIAGLWRRLASGEPVTAEGAHRRKDGTAFPVEIRFGLLGEAAGRRLALSIARAITERRAPEERPSRRALHDPLTWLPNRVLLMDRLERAVARAHRRKTRLTVLFLDLDDFKAVNDAFGHECGDHLLGDVGRRLGSGARPSDTVARLGGDEFVVLFDDVDDEKGAALVADRMRKELEVPFEVGRRELSVTASIGVALGPSSGPRELLREADLAKYRAKQRGKNRHELYAPARGERARTR